MSGPLRHVLVRVIADGFNELSGTLIPEILRRDVTFRVNHGGLDPGEHTMGGIVMIGTDDHEPLARAVGRVICKIMRTEELMWLPVAASREFGAWTIEAVPLLDWMRLATRSDEAVLRTSGINPQTGRYIGQEPPR
jgi:hypothetical protein